jgi:GT2 family glycosyltransferase
MLTVSLVIPIKNSARTLPACLHALDRLNPAPAEVFVIDNGSTDGSLALLKAWIEQTKGVNVRLLREAKPGASAARNTGIRAARGDIVAFTDSDCVPQSDWLSHLLAPFDDADTGAVAGRIAGVFDRTLCEMFCSLYTLQSAGETTTHREWTPWSGGFPTANLAVRRRLLEQLDGFDETVKIYGEDYDLCARLYEQQAAIVYTPTACVMHHHRTTLRGLIRQAFGFGRSHAYLLQRHHPQGLWLELPRRLVQWTALPMRGWVDVASPDKKALALLAMGCFYRPSLWLFPLYLLWLIHQASARARAAGAPVSLSRSFNLAWLLIVKAGAMTAGRWWGSVRYGALCL